MATCRLLHGVEGQQMGTTMTLISQQSNMYVLVVDVQVFSVPRQPDCCNKQHVSILGRSAIRSFCSRQFAVRNVLCNTLKRAGSTIHEPADAVNPLGFLISTECHHKN
jgi:hypothetical protein